MKGVHLGGATFSVRENSGVIGLFLTGSHVLCPAWDDNLAELIGVDHGRSVMIAAGSDWLTLSQARRRWPKRHNGSASDYWGEPIHAILDKISAWHKGIRRQTRADASSHDPLRDSYDVETIEVG